MKKPLLLFAAGALLGAALCSLQPAALAQSAVTTAYCGGLQSQPQFVPALFVFNTTGSTLTLDLVLRAPDGSVLVDRSSALTVAARATGTLNLTTELAHAGPNMRPYRGVFSAEISGDANLFYADTAIVHVTQYFGSIKAPRGACIIRPVFQTE